MRTIIVQLKVLSVESNSFGDQVIHILNLTTGETYTETNPEGSWNTSVKAGMIYG